MTVATFVLFGPILACTSGSDSPTGDLRIAAGEPAGVYSLYGDALAGLVRQEWPKVEPRVLTTAASAENLQLLRDGKAEVGFTQADVAASAGASESLTALARVYDDYVHLVVLAQAPLRTIADLKGRPVSVGAAGSGTEITANRLLDVGGLSPLTEVARCAWGWTTRSRRCAWARSTRSSSPVACRSALSPPWPGMSRSGCSNSGAYVAARCAASSASYYAERVVPRSIYGITAGDHSRHRQLSRRTAGHAGSDGRTA